MKQSHEFPAPQPLVKPGGKRGRIFDLLLQEDRAIAASEPVHSRDRFTMSDAELAAFRDRAAQSFARPTF